MARHYYIAEPYPDELIGSILIRTARHRGLGNKRLTQLLVGSRQSRVPLLLSSQLRAIANATRASPSELLHEHTPFRFITAFMSSRETDRVAAGIIGGSQGSLAVLVQSVTIGGRQPRYCQLCVKDDLRTYGESYWHRKHNLPFVDECPVHGVLLVGPQRVGSCFSGSSPPDECDCTPIARMLDGETGSWLARQSIATLETTFRQSVDEWSARYRAIAQQSGFPRATTGLCGKSFCAGLLAFYGDGFFKRHGWPFGLDGRSWPALMLREKNMTSMVTGKHLALQGFLALGPTPTKRSTVTPGRKTRNYAHMDRQFCHLLSQRMAQEPLEGRPTACELMTELGFWGIYRHQKAQLPQTRALVDRWYQAYLQLRKAGLAP